MKSFCCPNCRHKELLSDNNQTVIVCPNCHVKCVRSRPSKHDGDQKVDPTPRKDVHGTLTRPTPPINMEELIDMTAMVDIVFFLLIFFLVTSMSAIQSSSPFPQSNAQQEGKSSKGVQAEEAPVESYDLVITIGEDDVIQIDGAHYRDKADLLERLKIVQSHGNPDLAVLIIGNGNASHGTLANVLDAAYEAGLNHLRFAVTEVNVD